MSSFSYLVSRARFYKLNYKNTMPEFNINLPSKPKVVSEKEFSGVYEIDGLYPGYGHTLGNSLRRIILSSLPGAAITSVKISGVEHEFSTISGIKEDVITILLNLKKVRIQMHTDTPQVLTLEKKGTGVVTAGDIKVPGQMKIINSEQKIAEVTDKNTSLSMEFVVEKGLGYVSRETLQQDKVEIGTIALDAIFTPIRRVNYEVENMRVGERTDFNRLRIFIESDGTITSKEALENSIEIMINQLKAIVGFKEEEQAGGEEIAGEKQQEKLKQQDTDLLKTRVDSLDLSTRTMNALTDSNVRTLGGLVKKKESDILAMERIGDKGLKEIKAALGKLGVELKD